MDGLSGGSEFADMRKCRIPPNQTLIQRQTSQESFLNNFSPKGVFKRPVDCGGDNKN